MKNNTGVEAIVFAALISVPMLIQAQTTDDAAIQSIQTEVDIAKSKADQNAAAIESMKGGIPQAIAAEASAREAADAAEASARMAADSALEAALAAEVAARIEADFALQGAIDDHAAVLLDLEDRVSALESLPQTRSVTWVETPSFDVVGLAGVIAGLDYQPGEWVFIVSRNAQTGIEFGNCTNQPQVADWLNAVASETTQSAYVSGNGSYFYYRGSWYSSPTFQVYTDTYTDSYGYRHQFMQVRYPYSPYPWRHFVSDRFGNTTYTHAEVYSYYRSGGIGFGNTLTINVDADRQVACGV